VHQSNRINSGLNLSRDEAAFDARIRAHTVLRQASTLAPNSGSLDTWIITDESPRGFGARVNKYANILARPDKLIGLVIDQDTSKIAIGMIRSVKPTQGGQLRVGIEILSNKPVWVQLRASKNSQLFTNSALKIEAVKDTRNVNSSATVDIGSFSGIYLPIEEGLSEKATLILPKMNFVANNNYLLTVYGVEKHVFLANPIEARDDWVKVEVSI
jgi:cyclic-di-GMP-binding protein